MYKSNTTRKKTIHPLLVQKIGGDYLRGEGLISNFGRYEVHLIEGGAYSSGAQIQGFTVFCGFY